MDKLKLYTEIAERKHKPKDLEPYTGGNGRVDRCVELFRKGVLKTGGVLVDVGGGIGDLGYALRNDFDQRIVVDISAKNLQAARKKGNHVLLADVDRDGLFATWPDAPEPGDWSCGPYLGVNGNDIDVVTALDFIEHIIDPENFARHCFNVLKSGGQVFLNTPNIRFWRHLELLAVHGKFPHTSGDREVYHGGHLAFFTYRDLCEIFRSAGFKDFRMIKDDEGYVEPPTRWTDMYFPRPSNQQEYIQMHMELGCPNLLFLCQKP